jgi:hypothetical protein
LDTLDRSSISFCGQKPTRKKQHNGSSSGLVEPTPAIDGKLHVACGITHQTAVIKTSLNTAPLAHNTLGALTSSRPSLQSFVQNLCPFVVIDCTQQPAKHTQSVLQAKAPDACMPTQAQQTLAQDDKANCIDKTAAALRM